DVRVIQRIGGEVGCEVARVYLGLALDGVTHRHEKVWESGAPLGKWAREPRRETDVDVKVISRTVHLPVIAQPPLEEAQARVDAAQARLDALKQAGAPTAEVEAATFVVKRANMARSRAEMYGGLETFPIEMHLLKIGPAVLVGVEGEPFAEIGLAVKAASPVANTWFGGYTGGWAGYVPTAEAYPLLGYEVETSPFAPEAADILVAETVAALKDLEAGR
ncbi:MAG: hypothetical protein JNM64_05990, partial [Chloroflexia bacterium]|nr:hypothetical protein [Chloroflexia bacterium]